MKSLYQNQINNAVQIDLAALPIYTGVSKIFKQLDIREYVYCFVFNDIIVKYGYSVSGKMFGERAYRQSGHLDGWYSRLNGSSGSDMRVISDQFVKEYGYPLNRNGMVLYVIDMNREYIAHKDPFTPTRVYCEELERELINDCIDYHGKAPIGNRDNQTKFGIRVIKGNKAFNNIFEMY